MRIRYTNQDITPIDERELIAIDLKQSLATAIMDEDISRIFYLKQIYGDNFVNWQDAGCIL